MTRQESVPIVNKIWKECQSWDIVKNFRLWGKIAEVWQNLSKVEKVCLKFIKYWKFGKHWACSKKSVLKVKRLFESSAKVWKFCQKIVAKAFESMAQDVEEVQKLKNCT